MKAKNYFLILFIFITSLLNAQINPYVYYTFDGGTNEKWNAWKTPLATTPQCISLCSSGCSLTFSGAQPGYDANLIGPVGNYVTFTNTVGQMRKHNVNLSSNGLSFETLIRFNQGTGLQSKASIFSLNPVSTSIGGIYLSFSFDLDVSGGSPSINFVTDLDGNFPTANNNFNIPLNGLNRKSIQYYLDNQWHHIAISYNATTGEKKVWIDGICPQEFISFAAIGIFSESSAKMNVNPNGNEDRIYGDIDELAYYDDVISNEEIAQHFNDFTTHSHYTYQLTQPASNNIALSSDPDPNEFPVGHVIGGGELSSAQVVNSGLKQLYSYSLPGFLPTNLLHKNMNLVRSKHFGDNSSSDDVRKRYLSLYYQIELATNWNYYFNLAENLSREDGDVNDLNSHAGNWMQWILAQQNDSSEQFSFAVFTNRVQVAGGTKIKYQNFGPDQENYYNVRYDATTNLPENPYQFVDRGGNNSLSKFWLPKASISHYASDGVLSKSYLDKILTKLNSTLFKVNFIAENNEAAPVYWFDANSFNTIVNAPNAFVDNYAIKTDCNCSTQIQWKEYLGDKKVALDNDYRTTLLNDTRLANTNYLNYGCDGGPVDRYYWPKLRETQLFDISGANGIFKNSYSTIDYYPITPSRWKVQNVNLTVNGDQQVPRGWKWVARARQEELRIYDKLMAPYVGAGWYPDEERNFRPGQWLGVLKCLGLTGVDFYHAYYDYADGEPKGYVWQVVSPSYAQAILSRIDHIIVYGKVLNGDLLATPGNTSQGPSYSFNSGNPLHLVTIRQDSDAVAQALIPKYAISGSIQKIINMIGDAPLSQDVQIDLKAGISPADNLQFNIRRQGSTYVLDRTRSNSNDYAFYQLDKWHQWEHPERWSKDLDFEAEVFDNPTATLEESIHTEDVNHTAITNGDYRNFTSYVSGSANIYQYNFQPRVDAATTYYAFIRCRRNGGTATTSSIQVDLNDITGANSFPSNTIGCIASNDWLWYMVYDISGNALQYSLSRHNYLLSIQASDNNILIDRIYFGLTNAAPENGIAVASYNCPGSIQFTTEVTPVSCYGASSGSIKMTASGVTSGNYDFAINGVWQSGTNPFTNSIMAAGSYSLQVRDHNNINTVSQFYLVTISQPLTPCNCIMQVANNCNNLNDGKITAVVTGGNLNNYTYQWSNGEKNGTIENLSNGTYTVTVTDVKGCSVSNNATIVTKIFQASAISGNASGTGCGSGSLTISLVSGSGTAPYLFSIDGGLNYINNNNSSSFTIYNRTPGNYICQLKDFDGCLASMSGNPVNIVTGTSGFTTTITANPLNLSCSGLTSNFTLTPSPASSDYKYLWSTGQNTKNISNKSAGTYTVVVTNTVTACISQNVVTVTEPPPIAFNFVTTDVLCMGLNNGTAAITPGTLSGGTGTLNVLWSTGSTMQSISGLTGGNYSVTVTDINGCILTKYFTIFAPNLAPVTSILVNNFPTCGGGTDGIIKVSTIGGLMPYTYLWSTGQTTRILSNVSEFNYTVTVTDVNGCSSNASLNLTTGGVITSVTVTDITCYGGTGSIVFSSASGGSGTYEYSINDGQTYQASNIFSGLAVGSYIAIARDASTLLTSCRFQRTVQFQGTNCCISGIPQLVPSDFQTTGIIGPTGTIGTNGPIQNLNTSVTIPPGVTITIDNCTLYMAVNVSITVSAGATLIIQNQSILAACGDMWQGIINRGGTVVITNSTIEDAIEGLFSFDGAQFNISGSTFDRNAVGIYLLYGDFTQSSITSTEFKCTDGRIIKEPYKDQLTGAHIILESVDYFKLGSSSNSSDLNTFRNAVLGCYIINSAFDAVNNDFEFDKTVPYNVTGSWPRTAILNSSTYSFADVNIGDVYTLYGKNNLSNWERGIQAQCYNSSINIINNIINDCDLGTDINGNAANVNVSNNEFNNCYRGAFIHDLKAVNVTVSLNLFNNGFDFNAATYGHEAIRCENSVASSSSIINIWENNIYSNAMGIHVRLLDGALINNNRYVTNISNDELQILGDPHFGIWLEGTPNSIVDNNSIVRGESDAIHQSGFYQKDNFFGISADLSEITNIKNNTTINMGTDINMKLGCLGSDIRCNSMTDSYRGINFDAAAFVSGGLYGDYNDATENSWNGQYINNSNERISGLLANGQIDWYFEQSNAQSNPYCPFNSLTVTPVANASGAGCPRLPDNGWEERVHQNIKAAALNNIQYEEYIDENQFNDDKAAFEKAKDDTTLLQSFGSLQTIINQWYTTQKQSNIGKYKEVQDYIDRNFKQAAQITTSTLGDNTLILLNIKIATQIYLDHFFDNNSAPLDDISRNQLESIAYQTVALGGQGVYMARAMLGLDIIDVLPVGSRNAQNVKLPLDNRTKCIIYPNPAKNNCLISFNTIIDHIEVTDLVGKQNLIYNINQDQLQFTLDLNQYNPGMYALKLLKDTRLLFIGKLIVIK